MNFVQSRRIVLSPHPYFAYNARQHRRRARFHCDDCEDVTNNKQLATILKMIYKYVCELRLK